MSILKINTIYNTIRHQQNIININKSLIKCNQTIIDKKLFVINTCDSNQIIKINKCLTDYLYMHHSSILNNYYLMNTVRYKKIRNQFTIKKYDNDYSYLIAKYISYNLDHSKTIIKKCKIDIDNYTKIINLEQDIIDNYTKKDIFEIYKKIELIESIIYKPNNLVY